MADLFKLELPPDRDSYEVDFPNMVVINDIPGGDPRIRLDNIGYVFQVPVTWKTDPDGYNYLCAFWRTGTSYGSQSFLMDLVLDRSDSAEYTCKFAPGTFKLSQQSGLSYVVTATLYVRPLVTNREEDLQYIAKKSNE